MNPRTAWLLVPLVAAAFWLAVRCRGEVPGPRSAPTATRGGDPSPAGDGVTPPSDPAAAVRGARAAPVTGDAAILDAVSTGASAAVPGGTTARHLGDRSISPTGSAPDPAPAPSRPRPPPLPDDEAPAGKLTDRTGWGDASIGKQLNKEFMPLASECIDQAQARNPRLEGLLSFRMVVAPTDTGRVIVASLTLLEHNQIQDPDLIECIRESSFSLEGLRAPHDFDITMPIRHEGSG